MYDLVPDIDRRAPFLQGQFDDLDGAVYAGAKAARGGEVKGQWGHRVLLGRTLAKLAFKENRSKGPVGAIMQKGQCSPLHWPFYK
jgi:hypothetical protein